MVHKRMDDIFSNHKEVVYGKNPLHYQLSEYDCGPTAMLDAISYLFPREEIPPEIIRNIMLYCLDCYNMEGRPGKAVPLIWP